MNTNRKIFYILSFLRNTWFWLGTWIFYYLRFTDYAGIGLIETALYVALISSEIPTGAIADLIGKRKALIISFGLQTIGMGLMAFAQGLSGLIVGVFIAGVGGSFFSGTFDAIIYDTLKEQNKADQYDKIISKIRAVGLATPAICGLIGGFLYTIAPNIPFVASASFYFIGFLFSFALTEPHVEKKTFSVLNFFKQTKQGVQELFKTSNIIKQTILFLSIGIIIVVCSEMINDFLAVEFGYKPTQLAILFSFTYLTAALASHATHHIKKLISYKRATYIAGFLIALTLLISPIVGMLIGGFAILFRSSLEAVYENLTSILINQQTASAHRATTLSAFNLLKSIPYACLAFSFGVLTNHYTAIKVAEGLGVILLFLIMLQLLYGQKHRLKM
jgi:MFS family permease